MNPKAPKFKVNDRVRITKYKNILSKGYTENQSREMFIVDSALKSNPQTCKIKDINGEKNNRKFLGKRIDVDYIINQLFSRTRHPYQR